MKDANWRMHNEIKSYNYRRYCNTISRFCHDISRWIHSLEPGWRLRLYLVDLPQGMSVDTLAITVVAPERNRTGAIRTRPR